MNWRNPTVFLSQASVSGGPTGLCCCPQRPGCLRGAAAASLLKHAPLACHAPPPAGARGFMQMVKMKMGRTDMQRLHAHGDDSAAADEDEEREAALAGGSLTPSPPQPAAWGLVVSSRCFLQHHLYERSPGAPICVQHVLVASSQTQHLAPAHVLASPARPPPTPAGGPGGSQRGHLLCRPLQHLHSHHPHG